MTTITGSYHVAEFAANLQAEIRRLDAQVDLFWQTEKRLLRRHGLTDGMTVLDCGCGSGRLLELFATELQGLSLTGLEIDPILVDASRQRFASTDHQVAIHQGSAEQPGLDPSSFDFIVMRLVLEHVPDPVAVLKSVASLLKPGGRIAIIANDFEFHLRTSPSVAELDPLYEAYCLSRRQDGGDPCIGRRLPVLFTKAGLVIEGYEMEVSHSKLIGDNAFFQSEGVGIPAELVESGFLDQQTFENMIRSWKRMLKDPDHSIMRPLFVGVARLPSDAEDVSGIPDPKAAGNQNVIADHAEGREDPNYVEPSSDTEQKLANLWSSAMKVSRVGVQSNFFDLGGDSLMLEQLQSDVTDRFGIQVPMAVLFQYPTIEQLAVHLDNNMASSAGNAARNGYRADPATHIADASKQNSVSGTSRHPLNVTAQLQSKAERHREALSNKKRRAKRV